MSAKNLDRYERWRNVNVSFRVSPEESKLINSLVKISGQTKQDYIIECLLSHEIVVQPNPRVYKALKDELATILDELKRIEAGEKINGDLLDLIDMISKILNGTKDE